MLAYQYTFLDFTDIIGSVGTITEQNTIGVLVIIIAILTVIIMNFVIIPVIIFMLKRRAIKIKKIQKKNLLTEILLKKELEDEIEKEISIDKNTT